MSTKTDDWEKEFDTHFGINKDEFQTEYETHIKQFIATLITTLRKEQEEAYTKGYNAGLADGTGKPLLAIEQMREEAVARERLRLARVVIDASMIDEDEINEADFDDVSKTDAFMIGIEHVHKAFREALAPQNTKTDTTNSDKRDEDQHREQCEGRY